jgi:hypothetical protein
MDRPTWPRSAMWALGFGAVTTVGLGVLTGMLILLHAFVSGVIGVIGQPGTEAIEALEPLRYVVAFAVGAVVNLAVALSLVWVASRTPARDWPPLAQGALAAFFAAVLGLWALLQVLGIGLVDFVLGLLG